MCIYLQYRDMLKCINHGMKISKMLQPNEPWFREVFELSGMKDFSRTWYGYIDHCLLSSFVEGSHKETLSNLPINEITITLDDVACLLHLPINGRLLVHSRISEHEDFDLMVTQFKADLAKIQGEIEDIMRCHVRFSFLSINDINHLNVVMDVAGDAT